MASKTGPKGPRNKAERVLLIHGKPDILYTTSLQTSYSVNLDGKIIPVGKIGKHVVSLLEKIPGAKVIKELKETMRTKTPAGYGIKSIQQSASGDTTVRISAPTEEELIKRIGVFEEFTAKNGYDIQERCLWVCKVDPKSTPVQETILTSEEAREILAAPPGFKIKEELENHTPEPMSEKTKRLQDMAVKMGVVR